MPTYIAPNRAGWIPADSFPNRLHLVRREARVSVEELGEMTGISHSTISSWERGTRPGDIEDACRKIADKLGCSYEWLLYGSASLERLGGSESVLSRDGTGPGRQRRRDRPGPIRMFMVAPRAA